MRKILFALTFSLAVPCSGFVQPVVDLPQSPELSEASRLTEKASDLQNQSKYDEALALAKRALDLREKALGSEHELVATSLNKVAGIYTAKTRYPEAEALYRRSLKILEKRYGPDSRYLTDTLERLAMMRFAQHNYTDAENLYARSLVIKEKVFGPDQIETAQTLTLLGKFYARINKPDNATESFNRSVSIREKVFGPNHPDLLETLDDCACVLILNDRIDEGNRYQERAKAIRHAVENETVRPGAGVLVGTATLKVRAQYPDAAWPFKVRGIVIVDITVDECGRVINASAVSGPKELREAAVSAARGWRFTPTKVAGRPVKVAGSIEFKFDP